MQNYKELKVWEKAHEFKLKIYDLTKPFPKEEQYGLTNQIRRAAFLIPANIAEGCGKNLQLEFAQFLNIAIGSANEAEYFLILSKDLKFLDESNFNQLIDNVNSIRAMLISLINKVRDSQRLKT